MAFVFPFFDQDGFASRSYRNGRSYEQLVLAVSSTRCALPDKLVSEKPVELGKLIRRTLFLLERFDQCHQNFGTKRLELCRFHLALPQRLRLVGLWLSSFDPQ